MCAVWRLQSHVARLHCSHHAILAAHISGQHLRVFHIDIGIAPSLTEFNTLCCRYRKAGATSVIKRSSCSRFHGGRKVGM